MKPSRPGSRRWPSIPGQSTEDVLPLCDQKTLDLAASFQRAVVNDLVAKTLHAADEQNVRTIFVTGGVAANSELRQTFEREANRAGVDVFFPSRRLSTDNAAMIAAAAYPRFLQVILLMRSFPRKRPWR